MGIKNRRVAFTFDDRSLQTLDQMTHEGRFASMAETVRESLQINRTFQALAAQGFTEVILRRPATGQERTLTIPRLSLIRARAVLRGTD
ncbi:hypothetical protein [Deinococcus sp. 12RED42]|uniref:hypothetical protein n=1 Tax=Deinococcus sp. 12RED42 TaxID=2745872 RepID=UPI001E632CFE|nr:hypothetical protein [Deinococcus sp. 12RED42]MCD0167280.1 hypothetical protein [Deinococcus sp. 12RED42]